MKNILCAKQLMVFSLFLGLLAAAGGLLAAGAGAQERFYYGWTPPPEYAKQKNPLPSSPKILRAGERIYLKRCATCHGTKGDGEGISTLSLSTPPSDFTDKRRMDRMSDGALFWKILVGRKEMPPYQLLLKDEEIWKVVALIRHFSKK